MKRHIARDGFQQKPPNKVGMNDTTVPLRTPIPISFQPGLMLMTWNNYVQIVTCTFCGSFLKALFYDYNLNHK